MLVSEQIDPCFATSIVEPSLDEHSQHGTLASVDIAHDSNSCLDDLVHILRTVPYDELAAQACVFCVSRSNLNVAANVPGHENLVVRLDELANSAYSLKGRVPVLPGEAHSLAVVLEPDVEEDLAMAFSQALLDVLSQSGDILLGRIDEQRLQANVGLCVVRETELVEDAQLVMVLEDRGSLARES